MNARKQKKQAKDFIERWRGRGNERQDSQSFWLDLLGSVFGIENPSTYITFEDKSCLIILALLMGISKRLRF